jgi:hypothetical protein
MDEGDTGDCGKPLVLLLIVAKINGRGIRPDEGGKEGRIIVYQTSV